MIKPTKKEMREYEKHVANGAKKIKLTVEDMHNLTDLEMMLPHWFYDGVLKPNNMAQWFDRFFGKIEEVTLYERKEKKK